MKNVILTALAFLVACSAFTSTPKYNYHESYATASVRRYNKSAPFTKPVILKNKEFCIRQRDSSLAFITGDAGDVSFLNVLFFVVVYSLGIYGTTVESSKSMEEKKAEPTPTVSISIDEEASNEVEDVTQSVEDNVEEEQKPEKTDAGPIKKVIKRIFKSEATKVEPSSVKEEESEEVEVARIIQMNAEKREEDRKLVMPTPTEQPKSAEIITKQEASTDFTDLKKQVATTAVQYPDITETLKKVASTKESQEERYRLMAQNAAIEEEEQKPIPIPHEEPPVTPPSAQDQLQNYTTKRKGFRNRIKRIAKKVVMPWRKFSEIQ